MNEEVIVKNVYMGKKIRSKAEKTFPGVVKNRKNHKYQVEYIKDGKKQAGMVPC